METVSENIEILLNDFFNLQESGKEAFIKCFVMMLKEFELEVILQALDFKNNFSLSYDNTALDNTVVSETGMEDLIGKVLCLGKEERTIFIRFLIIKSKTQEIDLILHVLDSRRELNKKIEEDDNLTKSSDKKDNINDFKKKKCESLTDSRECSQLKIEYDSTPVKLEEIFLKEDKNSRNFYEKGENNTDRKDIKGFIDVNEDTESTEVDMKASEEYKNVNKKGLKENDEYKVLKVNKEDNNIDGIESKDVKMVLKKPERIYNPQIDEYLPCHLCSKSIKRIFMTAHTKSGNCAKSLVCDVCGKVSSTYGNLKKHKVIHTNEYKFLCNFCSKGFHHKQTLNLHESKIHSNSNEVKEECYQCSLCPKAFDYKTNLSTHQRIHRERSYFCDLCPKRFTQKSNLVAHRRKHTGEKPFSCSKCGKCFSDPSNMKQHMKKQKC